MSHDPDEDGDAESNKKTRLVMRPDVADGSSSGAFSSGGGSPRGGAVIGTTRLVGNQGQINAPPGGTMAPGAPTMKMQNQGKTQYVREGTVDTDPVAGWIVVVKGPGRGGFRPVYVGMNSVGRGSDQRICLDFGDDSISREEHAFITYDDETRTFYLQHGGKSNLVRLAGKPVLAPTELKPADLFKIGNTTFRFVANWGPEFEWSSVVNVE
jgi:hypothetical protein